MSIRKSNISVCRAARDTSALVRVRRFGESMYALAVRSAMKTVEKDECQYRWGNEAVRG